MVEILKEFQHIVLMPRCSRHILAGSTLGLKAAAGYWRHDTRPEYHHGIINHVVNNWLGGWRPALESEKITNNSLNHYLG